MLEALLALKAFDVSRLSSALVTCVAIRNVVASTSAADTSSRRTTGDSFGRAELQPDK